MNMFRVTANMGMYRVEKRFLWLFWKRVEFGNIGGNFNFPLIFQDKESALAICGLMERQFVLTNPASYGWRTVK